MIERDTNLQEPTNPALNIAGVMCRYLCKRSLIIGDPFYYDENNNKIKRDNRMFVAGDWYYVVFNENDNDETFTVIDNQGHKHLLYMYGEENDNNYNLPRTYAKWFYTPKELEKKKQRELKRAL